MIRSSPRALLRALVVALVLGVACRAAAAGDDAPRAARPWFVPDHLSLQFAGEIGFLSPGIGYRLAGGKVRLDALFGWVPASIGGVDIYSLTGKATFAPWTLTLGERWRLDPFHVTLQGTHVFGSRYFTKPPSRYPNGYYDLPTAWYSGEALGTAIARRDDRGREVSLYLELVSLTMQLRDWWRNQRVVDLSDVVSLAIGVQVAF